MTRVLIAGIVAGLVSIFAGPRFIAFLRREEFGQQIREEGPAHHAASRIRIPPAVGVPRFATW